MRSLEHSYLLGVDGVTEIWLVRHADVYDELDDVDDPPLSKRGQEQARRLAKRLEPLQFAAVYASPLRRAQETARPLNRPIQLDARLAEAPASFHGGRLEILESPDEIIARMRTAVEAAVASHPGGKVLMVGHGIAILSYLGDVLGIDAGRLRMYPPYTGLSIIRAKHDRRVVATVFDTAHLQDVP